jgi:hypothetical protein
MPVLIYLLSPSLAWSVPNYCHSHISQRVIVTTGRLCWETAYEVAVDLS